MKVKVYELSSGFANIENTLVLDKKFTESRVCSSFNINVPDDWSISKDETDTISLYDADGTKAELFLSKKKNHIEAVRHRMFQEPKYSLFEIERK